MTIYLTSDEHYYHENISKYCNRPFNTTEEMNQYLIDSFNKKVTPDDITYHLGDFTFKKQEIAFNIIEQLNGHHYFIRGNHDSWLKNNVKHKKIFNVKDYDELKINGQDLILSHYPMYTWNKARYNSWMLHGHCHSNINKDNESTKRLDVGVDSAKKILGDYVPFSFADIKVIMESKVYKSVDHHIAD